jgi:tetratricopeptide (TPR) repeat protein
MSHRSIIRPIALAALTAISLGCRSSDQSDVRSATAGGTTPVVSGTTVDTAEPAVTTGAVDAKPVSYEQAESTYSSGRYPEAVQLFTLYTEAKPENAWGHYMLGLSAWKNGESDRALAAFDRALELDPNHRKSMYNASRVLLEKGRPQEALDRIEQALTQEPQSTEGLRLLGRAKYQMGKVDEAIEAYRRALATDERDVWSMNNLGLIYIEQERSSEALAPLARAVQLRSNAPVFQNNLGVALERSGYPVAAAKAYEAAIEVDSTYTKASVALARVTGGQQQPESEPVDLDALALRFESEIDSWRGTEPMTDSTEIVGVASDSSTAEIEASTDTLGGHQHEE